MLCYLDVRCYFEVKITSIFFSYRFLRIAWYDIFSLSDHFRSFQQTGICISPVTLRRSRSANAHLLTMLNAWTSQRLLKSNPKFTIVLIWKSPPCLKLGKTSNRAVENLPQRKLWVWAANDARSQRRFWSHRTSVRACFFGNDRSSHSRVRTRFWLRSPSTTRARVTYLHIPVPAITSGTLVRPRALRIGDFISLVPVKFRSDRDARKTSQHIQSCCWIICLMT